MTDSLTAIGLLLAVLVALLVMLTPDATATLKTRPHPHRESRDGQIDDVRGALWRIGALALVAFGVAAVFSPLAFTITIHAVTEGGEYDIPRMAFVAAEALVIGLFAWLVTIVLRLLCRLIKLRSSAELHDWTGHCF